MLLPYIEKFSLLHVVVSINLSNKSIFFNEIPEHLKLLHGFLSSPTFTYTVLFTSHPTLPPYKALEHKRLRTKDPLLHGLSHPDHSPQAPQTASTEI